MSELTTWRVNGYIDGWMYEAGSALPTNKVWGLFGKAWSLDGFNGARAAF